MKSAINNLTASEAANRLGVSAKALRLYEQKGLLNPGRTSAGYRIYSADNMTRAANVVALRDLGLSLAQVAQVLDGESQSLQSALLAHEAALNEQQRQLMQRIDKVRNLHVSLADGHLPDHEDLHHVLSPYPELNLSFTLPWPWGGEWFELRDIRPLNYLIGPLGSGKTVLAHCIAKAVPGAVFVDLERGRNFISDQSNQSRQTDAGLQERVQQAMIWLAEEGATPSPALSALLHALEDNAPTVLVVDLVEDNLDESTQQALASYLRKRCSLQRRPLFVTTRSTAILDLELTGHETAIYSCPANHSPPFRVLPYPGAVGYESIVSCLASPDVRARTRGMIASIPDA
ncbi:Mercuric resistance operon regulatory protein [compost metagenome]